ncbi:hypothetical protein [Jiulongibacter sediminis]|nr:hypothetical protein [Jiulongibacter sediminis]
MSLTKKSSTRHALVVSLVLILITFSCVISPNDPNPRDLYGRWKLTDIEGMVDENSAPLLKKQLDYREQEFYFEFLPRGIFATNTDLGLNKLLLRKTEVRAGSYTYVENNNGTFVEITINDPQFDQNVNLKFEAFDLQGSSPSLVMDTQNYVHSIRTSSDNFSSELRNSMYEFTTRINQALFSLSFSKTN